MRTRCRHSRQSQCCRRREAIRSRCRLACRASGNDEQGRDRLAGHDVGVAGWGHFYTEEQQHCDLDFHRESLTDDSRTAIVGFIRTRYQEPPSPTANHVFLLCRLYIFITHIEDPHLNRPASQIPFPGMSIFLQPGAAGWLTVSGLAKPGSDRYEVLRTLSNPRTYVHTPHTHIRISSAYRILHRPEGTETPSPELSKVLVSGVAVFQKRGELLD